MSIQDRPPEYILSHSEQELRRLTRQHGLFEEFTLRLLLDAGIRRGMRILDVGSGTGDVSFMVAEIVGPEGAVVGVDKSAASVARARERAAAGGFEHVTFVEGDAATIPDDEEKFDGAVGRFVLAWVADPVRMVHAVARRVRAGGVVVFQDFDHPLREGRSLPDAPLFERTFTLCLETLRRAGFELRMGARLFPTMTAAGLPPPHMRMDVRIGGGPDYGGYSWLAESVRSLLPRMIEMGLVAAGEVDVDALAERLREEVMSGGGVMMLAPVVGAWSRRL